MIGPWVGQDFYRFFSDTSAGGLVSGKGKGDGRRLSSEKLLSEFKIHKEHSKTRRKKSLTALISVATALSMFCGVPLMGSTWTKAGPNLDCFHPCPA
jgi:hypothetical protein